jgi:integrase
MQTETMTHVLYELVRFEIAAADHARAIAPERTREEAQMSVQREFALQEVLKEALFFRNREIAREPVRAAAERLGVCLNEDTTDWMSLAYEATRALYDVSVERSRRDQGEFTQPSPLFQSAMATAVSQPTCAAGTHHRAHPAPVSLSTSPVVPPMSATTHVDISPAETPTVEKNPPAPSTPSPINLSEAFEMYGAVRLEGKEGKRIEERADEMKGKSYERNSYANLKSTAKLITAIIGNKAVSDLTLSDFTEAFSIIQKVPANHGKSSSEARTIRDIVRETDLQEQKNKANVHARLKKAGASAGNIEAAEHQENIQRLRVNTVYRHMQDTQRVLRFLIAHGYLTENFMETVIWSKRELERLEILQEDNSRKIWGDQLSDLFRTPVFQGAILDIGDPMFWGPLISVFHGMRQEETMQLRIDDVQQEKGIYFFDIKVGASWQHLKSKAATRRVPIHQSLIDLGLLDFVAMRRREGEDRLFPHLTRGKNRKSLSENFTKEFTRYRKANDVYEKRIDFHSFRTQFNVELIRAKTDSEMRHILMGHEMDSVIQKHYGGDGHDLTYLKEIVQRVDIDVSMIKSPFLNGKRNQGHRYAGIR